jgi:hypothetical protein
MSELPRRPNDHLVEPMFAALGREPIETTGPAPRRKRPLVWIGVVLGAAALIWFLVAD